MIDIELVGTSVCPICGYDLPHHHSDEQVAAYREDCNRNDGWISTAVRQPEKSGWYLCSRVQIDLNQYGEPKEVFAHHPKWTYLSWFLWVRQGENAPHFGPSLGGDVTAGVPEICYYERFSGWRLRNYLGNAVPSGAESRFAVHVQPKYWRIIPKQP